MIVKCNDNNNNKNDLRDKSNCITNSNDDIAGNNDNSSNRDSLQDSGWQLSSEFSWSMFKLKAHIHPKCIALHARQI